MSSTDPVIPNDLKAPTATFIDRVGDVVSYQCYCGEKDTCSPDKWGGGISLCSHGDFLVPYPRRDMTGVVFGRLTVTGWARKKVDQGHHYWACTCSCGKTKSISYNSLSQGITNSCGCITVDINMKRKGTCVGDLTGHRFGMLVAKRLVPKTDKTKTRGSYWECLCDCGNTKTVSRALLQEEKTRSCGCLTGKLRDFRGRKFRSWTVTDLSNIQHKNGMRFWKISCGCGRMGMSLMAQLKTYPPKCDCGIGIAPHIGFQFNLLTVIGEIKLKNGGSSWSCRCQCGETIRVVDSAAFENSNVFSCGCASSWVTPLHAKPCTELAPTKASYFFF